MASQPKFTIPGERVEWECSKQGQSVCGIGMVLSMGSPPPKNQSFL